jgi:membrane protein
VSVVARTRRTVDRVKALVAWARALVYRILDTVPPVRRTVDELLRVEFVDRAVVIAAQALFALVPLVVVLAAYFPHALHDGLDRFQSVTGLSSGQLAGSPAGGVAGKIGVVGLVVTLVSASSFARAMMRMYAIVWQVPPEKGLRGRGRSLVWLICWIAMLQAVSAVADAVKRGLDGTPVVFATQLEWLVQILLSIALWSWTIRFLLVGRVPWRRLWVAAVLSGVATTLVAVGSRVVMPRYTASSAQQFGSFGLVLAVAAWLVIFAEALVVAAVIGRVLSEDAFTRRWIVILLGSLPLLDRLAFFSGTPSQELHDEQHDGADDQQPDGERAGRVVGEHVDQDEDPGHGSPDRPTVGPEEQAHGTGVEPGVVGAVPDRVERPRGAGPDA